MIERQAKKLNYERVLKQQIEQKIKDRELQYQSKRSSELQRLNQIQQDNQAFEMNEKEKMKMSKEKQRQILGKLTNDAEVEKEQIRQQQREYVLKLQA